MINGADLTVMSSDNGFADGKPDAHAAMSVRSAVRCVTGTVKNSIQLVWINAYTVILDMKNNLFLIVGNR